MPAATPLRLDSALVKEARTMAVLMNRSPTTQVEFWAKLGRVAEAVFAHDRIRLLKETGRLQDLDALLAKLDTRERHESSKAVTARQCSLDRQDLPRRNTKFTKEIDPFLGTLHSFAARIRELVEGCE